MRKFKIVTYALITIAVLLSLVCLSINLSKGKEVVSLQEPKETPTSTEEPPKNPEKEAFSAQKKIQKEMEQVSGTCQWGYRIFSSNQGYMTESKAVPSASIIKVFIMEYAFDQMEKGNIELSHKVAGVPLEKQIHMMITQSDNDATNALIKEFGMEKMNQFFREKGYTDTQVQRKMLDTKAQQEGKENYTSIRDVMSFLEKLYQNKEREPYKTMLSIMKQQERRNKIPQRFPSNVTIANKTGELSDVENDIAIIFGEKSDYAIAFLCSSLSNTGFARDAISDAAYQFYIAAEEIKE